MSPVSAAAADFTPDDNVTVEQMSALLKGRKLTPYIFLRRAIVEATVKDNHIAADAYVRYALEFEHQFFDAREEEDAFGVNAEAIRAFISMHKEVRR